MASVYKSYVGEFATDAACLAYIQLAVWDDAGDGTGNPQDGMTYYNVNNKSLRKYNSTLSKWFDVADDSIGNLLTVDVNSTKTTVPDGTPHNPFKLLQNAVNAVIARGDNTLAKPYVIYVRTGDYTGEGQIILENSNIVNIVIIGESSLSHFGVGSVEVAGMRSQIANDGFSALIVKNIFFNYDVEFEGASNTTTMFQDGCMFENCYFSGTTHAIYSYNNYGMIFRNCYIYGASPAYFLNTILFRFYDCDMRVAMTVDADSTFKSPIPGTGVGTCEGFGSYFLNNNTFLNNAGMNTAGYFYGCILGNSQFPSTLSLPDGNTYVFTTNCHIYKNINLTGGTLYVDGTWYDPALLTIAGGTFNNRNYSEAVYYDNAASGMVSVNVQDALDELDTNKLEYVDLTKFSLIYYVDAISGNDTTGDGSVYKPFKTITKAIASYIPGEEMVIMVNSGWYVESSTLALNGENITIIGTGSNNTGIVVNNATTLSISGATVLNVFDVGFYCASNSAAHYILDCNNSGTEVKFYNTSFQDYGGSPQCNGIRITGNPAQVDFHNSWVYLNGTGLPLDIGGSCQKIGMTLFGAFTGANHACVIKDSASVNFTLSKLYSWEWAALTFNALRHIGTGTVVLDSSDIEADFSNDVCEITSTGVVEYRAGKVFPTTGTREFNIAVGAELKLGEIQCDLTKIAGAGTISKLWYHKPRTSTDAAAPNDTLYYSTTQNKLVYKDSGGGVHTLY